MITINEKENIQKLQQSIRFFISKSNKKIYKVKEKTVKELINVIKDFRKGKKKFINSYFVSDEKIDKENYILLREMNDRFIYVDQLYIRVTYCGELSSSSSSSSLSSSSTSYSSSSSSSRSSSSSSTSISSSSSSRSSSSTSISNSSSSSSSSSISSSSSSSYSVSSSSSSLSISSSSSCPYGSPSYTYEYDEGDEHSEGNQPWSNISNAFDCKEIDLCFYVLICTIHKCSRYRTGNSWKYYR